MNTTDRKSAMNADLAAQPNLRLATSGDTRAVINLAIAAGMFLADEVASLHQIFADVHSGNLGPHHQIVVWSDDETITGAVYFGDNPMADRVWDLWMIAVTPDRQGQGVGRQLMHFVETHATESGARLLMVETSSTPKYDMTRAFYHNLGYAKVATLPDYFCDGDSKVIFCKRLAPENFAEHAN